MSTYKKARSPLALLLVIVMLLAMIPATGTFAAVSTIAKPATTGLVSSSGSAIYVDTQVEFTTTLTNKGTGVWTNIMLRISAAHAAIIRPDKVVVAGEEISFTELQTGIYIAYIPDFQAGEEKDIALYGTVMKEASGFSYTTNFLGSDINGDQAVIAFGTLVQSVTHATPAPRFSPIYEGDKQITGTGVEGATVYVTLPNSNTVYTTEVGSGGIWTLTDENAEDNISKLLMGQKVYATQKETDKLMSEEAEAEVQKNQGYESDSTKTSDVIDKDSNQVKNKDDAHIGDKILYTITLKNTASQSSVWEGADILDYLPTGITLIDDTVMIGTTPVTNYTYSPSTGRLYIPVGNIPGGEERVVTFECLIGEAAGGTQVKNVAIIDEGDIDDPTPIDVIDKTNDPIINAIKETATYITGTVNAADGTTVYVTFPDNQGQETATVLDGEWSVPVSGRTLEPGKYVEAYAHDTVNGMDPSGTVNQIIDADYEQDNVATKTSTKSGDTVNVNDTITYTITAENQGSPSSTWYSDGKNVVITDTIPEGVTYVTGSAKVDNVSVNASYDSTYRTLTITLDELKGRSGERVVTFDVTVNDDAYGATIENTADVGGITVKDELGVKVIEQTKPPVIKEILDTDDYVTGTGEPGATIVVTWPNNQGDSGEIKVADDGTWSVEVGDIELLDGDVVTAVQTEDGKAPSEPAEQTVEGTEPDISLKKEWRNLNELNDDGSSDVGDIIQFTITAANNGSKSSKWDGIITDKLDKALDFIDGSISVTHEGVEYTNFNYSYDEANERTLTIELGDVYGQTGDFVVTFNTEINEDGYGETINNTATAGDEKADIDDPIPVIYRSEAPEINRIFEEATTVTGTGIEGSEIVVTWPNDTETNQIIVNSDNEWTVDVPKGMVLKEGQVVKAVQTETGKATSKEAERTVEADYDSTNPYLNKTWSNIDRPEANDGSVNSKVGDTIQFTITAGNSGTVSSSWNCVLTDVLDKAFEFQGDTVYVTYNGVTTKQYYSYNTGNRTLTIDLGEIKGHEEYVVTFEVKITADAYDYEGGDIHNTVVDANDDGNKGKTVDPIKVTAQSQKPEFNKVTEGDTTVTGTGIAGSTIVVTWPNGDVSNQITVDTDNTWRVSVPSGLSLTTGKVLEAVQTEKDKDPSEIAYTTVQGDVAFDPDVELTFENEDGKTSVVANDSIEYDGYVRNNGTASSTIENARMIVTLDSNVDLKTSSIRIGNWGKASVGTSAGCYTYDESTRTLTLYLGDIVGGTQTNVYFKVTVKTDIADIYKTLELQYLLGFGEED